LLNKQLTKNTKNMENTTQTPEGKGMAVAGFVI
jgi:hypothetical protein